MTAEYNKLNAAVAVAATRQLYGDVLNKYINDGGNEQGGVKWADKMLTDLTASPHAMRGYLRAPVGSVCSSPDKSGVVLLTKSREK